MLLTTEVAFYHKIGTISDGKVVFKYFMASLSPHFYFAIYVVPYEDTIDIFYIPKIDNLDSFAIIPLFDSSYGSIKDVAYGESVTMILSNEKILGMSEVVEIEVSIPTKPVIVNDVPASPLDLALAREFAREAADVLEGVQLYTLANQLMIIVESKILTLVEASAGVEIEGAAYSIIQQMLLDKSILYNSLPVDMSDEKKDIMHRMINTIVNLSPYNTNITIIFSDIVSFARSLDSEDISFEDIPYKVFYRLAYDTLSNGSTDSVADIEVAADATSKDVVIELNMSTMEEQSKVYELLSATQDFVYLTKIVFRNVESGNTKTITLENEDPDILIKKKDICVETRSIQSQGKQVTLQYGYGSGCDLFIGMLFTDEFGNYGIIREDKLLEGDAETSRMWVWGENSLEMFGNDIDSSNNIEVTFTGV